MNILRKTIRTILQESSKDWVYNSLTPRRPKPSDIDPYNESGIRFTGVKIEKEEEIRKIQDAIEKLGIDIPSTWKIPYDYHMTIQMGAMRLGKRIQDVGQEVELEVNSVGVSDEAIALGVSGYMSKNDKQHITIAFKSYPANAKFIKDWYSLKHSFQVKGIIREYSM